MQNLGLDLIFKGRNFERLMQGLWNGMFIALVSSALSIPLGLIGGMLMTSHNRFIKGIMRLYLEIVRIMPQLVLLFLVFFTASQTLGLNFDGTTSSIVVFTFWGTAEMSDLVRSSIESIPKGQYESAYALGMTRQQTFIHVIIPQTIRHLIPLSINLITRMIKTTSLVLMIGVEEMIKVSQQIIEANRMTSPNAAFGVYLEVFVIYFLICWIISLGASYLERRWAE